MFILSGASADDNSASTAGIYLSRAPSLPMLATRSRKTDGFLILLGLVIFILLILGVVLLVRRQPQFAPKNSGSLLGNTLTFQAVPGRPRPVPCQS